MFVGLSFPSSHGQDNDQGHIDHMSSPQSPTPRGPQKTPMSYGSIQIGVPRLSFGTVGH